MGSCHQSRHPFVRPDLFPVSRLRGDFPDPWAPGGRDVRTGRVGTYTRRVMESGEPTKGSFQLYPLFQYSGITGVGHINVLWVCPCEDARTLCSCTLHFDGHSGDNDPVTLVGEHVFVVSPEGKPPPLSRGWTPPFILVWVVWG